jgi:hypothetical protein
MLSQAMAQSLGSGTPEKHPIERPIGHFNLTDELKKDALKIDHCQLRWFGTKLA